ncbi:(R)-mandelonitrile lyase-like protein [Corchorus capsularis]|uniref:(R)-mandelonitrile lyase-like protein n=1 Tax=Corchorus capsularis TaxID=210143 RepID=A0A1R3KIH2_COCAP|nr:(R)-mandelonitrile lyase-like protein [Corchorus capsularis]
MQARPVNIKVAVYASVERILLAPSSSTSSSNVRSRQSAIGVVFSDELGRTPAPPLFLTAATIMEKIVWPLSSGSLRLASTDVRVNPIIWFNYFSNPMDVERFVGPALPADQSNDDEMAYFCRRTVSTIWHYLGECVVGKVVDQN